MIIEGTFVMDTKENKTRLNFAMDKKVNVEKVTAFVRQSEIEVVNQDLITQPQFNYINALATDFKNTLGESTQYYKDLLKKMYCDREGVQWFSTTHTTRENASKLIEFIIELGIQWGVQFKIPPYIGGTDPQKFVYACLRYRVCAKCGARHEDRITIDLHHQQTVASNGGRKMNDDKLPKMPLCRKCHQEAHSIGLKTFAHKYKLVAVPYKSEDWYGKKIWSRLTKSQIWENDGEDLDLYKDLKYEELDESVKASVGEKNL